MTPAFKSLMFGLPFALAASGAFADDCNIPGFNFDIVGERTWPATMTVRSGASCASYRWPFATMVPRRVFIYVRPQHGNVVVGGPDGYRYDSTRGYVGRDSFILRVCGNRGRGFEGCANIEFTVNVVN